MSTTETATKLLDSAQALVVERGYNAFSYKDLAEAVGIRTASIHYHFPTKGDLGEALMGRYVDGLDAALADIDRAGRSASAKLKRFIKVYSATESSGVLCLCGSLASDLETLPEPVQGRVTEYLQRSEDWLAGVISDGVAAGELDFDGKPADAAATLLASLQGGLLLARTREGRGSTLSAVQRVFLSALGAS